MRDALNKEGKKTYDELAKIIPGFHPVLDDCFLGVYVMQLQGIDRTLVEIETAETEQAKKILKNILKENKEQLKESAEMLGLTPASRREIEKNFKILRAQGKAWWEDD